MPELPEVEVLRRSLEPRLLGRRVERVEVLAPALREPLERRKLAALAGRRFVRLARRAKYLLADLEGERTLVVHLGMSGRLTLVPGGTPREAHEHLALHLDSGERLRLRDPRRFGLAFAVPTGRIAADRHLAGLGVEPLSGELDGARLAAAARGRRGPVKSFLLDGRIVAGVGNIYACEALFRAGIRPDRSVARLAAARWERLAAALVEVLAEAIEAGGTTLNDFADGAGREGLFQVALAVYGRAGEPCPRCGRTIRRTELAGRGTFDCPGCQR
ncbi:MAG TPA: bifunctional DNA-formamidopyrimidine glycosylase/DNA-(apurinic or apyrimidinic site) lyase [Thermoanaerobaculia bacterium]|nr:bifunctional DNA-formamidopyrimidine glycosylase/DNA-(apurinic or apyrimidinic site) lyase [Thermoanaerobaculia bacterium]